MEAQKGLIVERAGEWSPEAERLLSLACVHATPGELKGQFEAGAALFFARCDGEVVGAYLLRVDGSEGVIIAAAGDGRGIDLVGTLLPVMERQFLNCATVRIHTSRAGMVRRLTEAGYEPREIVLAKVLA